VVGRLRAHFSAADVQARTKSDWRDVVADYNLLRSEADGVKTCSSRRRRPVSSGASHIADAVAGARLVVEAAGASRFSSAPSV
jgi:hypothetical protein